MTSVIPVGPTRLSRPIATTVAGIVASMVVYGYGRTALDEMAARSLAIFVLAAVFWTAEILPLFGTALLVVVLQIILLASTGGLADEISGVLGVAEAAASEPPGTPISARAFIDPFASDVIMLFLGGFLLAGSMTRHGVDVALAARVLRPFARSSLALVYGLAALSAFFSMWMSNTATAAMMTALVAPLLAGLPDGHRFRWAILLAIAFGANIGGIGTPIGTPPNAIAFDHLNRAGYPITFAGWMLIAVPLEVLLLAIVGGILHARFGPESERRLALPTVQRPLSPRGKFTLGVLGLAIVLWLTGGQHGLAPGTVALLAAATLMAGGAIGSQDIEAIDWKVLILMWGALSLGIGVERSGLAGYLAGADLGSLPGGFWSAGVVVALIGVTVSTFMSNTAAAALLVPIALALALPGREELAVVAALSCSFAMVMPVSTPPNAIAYGTGQVPRWAMIQAGGAVTAIAMALLLAGYHFILPLAF
jgi:sodium-dependent dicarboxylate transporter 2/3/5